MEFWHVNLKAEEDFQEAVKRASNDEATLLCQFSAVFFPIDRGVHCPLVPGSLIGPGGAE